MSCEIEIKAHLNGEQVLPIIETLKKWNRAEYLGPIDKEDIYWASNNSETPIFRTRYEKNSTGERIYFTSKPLKKKDDAIECNVENEFEVLKSQWDNVQNFCAGLGLQVCRRKYKNGVHFNIKTDTNKIHCEILNVKYLGWFIESEIVADDLQSIDKYLVEHDLMFVLKYLEIPSDQIEARGYNKLLKEVGHEKG